MRASGLQRVHQDAWKAGSAFGCGGFNAVIDAGLAAGIPDIDEVGFVSSRADAMRAEARQRAATGSRTPADALARAYGADLGRIYRINSGSDNGYGGLDRIEEARNPVTYNDQTLTARILPSLEAVAGAGKVVETPLIMGAEDFSYYAKEVPSVFFFVGSTTPGIDPLTAPSNHSPLFKRDESALDLGVRAMLQLSLDYLEGSTAR